MSTYGEAYPRYVAAGWPGVLPLRPRTKVPPPDGYTGWHGDYPSGPDMWAWAEDEYAGTPQLALRMPPTVIGIDVDQYGDKTGEATLAEAERRWGPLPGAPISSARPTGGIRFFSVPAGTHLRTVIGFAELGLNGIEVIQRHHRYAVVWPSIHPSTGTQYRWRLTGGDDVPPRVDLLNPLPDAWIEALRSDGTPGAEAAHPETVAAFMREHATSDGRASVKGVLATFEKAVRSTARHDAVLQAACMGAREARVGCYPARDVYAALREAFAQALAVATPGQRLLDRAASGREFDSTWAWAVSQSLAEPLAAINARIKPRPLAAVPPLPVVLSAPIAGATALQLAPEPEQAPPPPVECGRLNLPPEFWDARPLLKKIRDSALSQWACPDAVLGCLLARQSAYAHPEDTVDIGIGPAPITLFTIPYGSPSAGKGKAVQVSRDLLPVPKHLDNADTNDGIAYYRERPLGSGEGLTESYFGTKPVEDPANAGSMVKTRMQVRRNILFVMDEGESLAKLAGRQGSTIATTIRRAWSGELLGEANASADRDRQLDRGKYSIGLIVAFQPATIAPLFDSNEVGGGTPHRFLFVAADDDTLPETPPQDLPEWDGPLLPELDMIERFTPAPRAFKLTDPEAVAQVKQTRWDGLRRSPTVGELDGHMNLMRGRVAAHLALLDGRTDIDREDWHLAGMVVEASTRVRDAAVAYGQTLNARQAQSFDDRLVGRDARAHAAKLALEEQKEAEKVARVAALLARKVLKTAPVDGMTRRALRDTASRYRDLMSAGFEYAVELGWLVEEVAKQGGSRYRVGPRIGDVPPA